MAKIKLLATLGICGLMLAACGDGSASSDNVETQEATTEESSAAESVESSEESETESKVTESEFGTMTTLAQVKDMNETQQTGPFNITVEAIQKSQLQPTADYVELFGGEDLAVISIQLSVENTNDDTNAIYPDQGTIVTDTKQQVTADMLLSDSVGGDFIGQVIKDGTIQFIFEGNAEDINSFQYIIEAGHDANFDALGENLTFDFEF